MYFTSKDAFDDVEQYMRRLCGGMAPLFHGPFAFEQWAGFGGAAGLGDEQGDDDGGDPFEDSDVEESGSWGAGSRETAPPSSPPSPAGSGPSVHRRRRTL